MRRIARIIALLACVGTVASAQAPGPSADVNAQSRRAAERIRSLQREADALAAQARTVFGELRKLELARQIQAEETAVRDAQLKELEAGLAASAARLEQLKAQRLAATPGLEARLVDIYKRGRGGYARLFFENSDMRSIGRVSRGIAAVAEVDAVRIATHRRAVEAEQAGLADLQARRSAVAQAQAEAVKARAELDRAVNARNRLIDDLDRQRDLAARYVGELEAAQAAVEKAVSSAGAAGVAVPGLPIGPFRGALDWPVAGSILSRFGRAPGRFGTAVVRNGIEVRAAEGTPVRAVHEGTVAFVAPFTGFGTLVIVDHGGGAFTLYGHLGSADVAQGARVGRGTTVGRVGLTPTGGPALYFELRVDGRPVNPVQWLRSSP